MSARTNLIISPPGGSRVELAEQVRRILQSHGFAGSETLRRLLDYLASRAADDRAEPIRVREVATEVFGRSADFDSQSDSVVRVHTGRLRSKLAEYYMDEGVEDELVITIPKGGYALAWHARHAAPTPVQLDVDHGEEAMLVQQPPETSLGTWRRKREPWWQSTILLRKALLLIVAALAMGWFSHSYIRHRQEGSRLTPALKTFWRGFATSGEEPLVVFSNFRLLVNVSSGLVEYSGPDDPNKPIVETYTTMGEVTGVFEVSRLLQEMGKQPTVKRGRLLTWDEAKDKNLVFVGGPLAETPLRDVSILKEFRFSVQTLPDQRRVGRIVNLHPRPNEQESYMASDAPATSSNALTSKIDYAIVALRPALGAGRSNLVVAGISEYGTQGAAEFVTRETSMKALLSRMKVGEREAMPWFEALLCVSVQGGVPVASEIVAIHRSSAGN